MEQHIAYAMRNEQALSSFIYFNSVSDLNDWSFVVIQLIILLGVITALIHAIKQYRAHADTDALLTLLNCFLYGLTIDILSYYTVENFWHGEFSVMLLYNRLPLYIALFYPAFMYHAFMMIKRQGFAKHTEAITTGFIAGFMYLIFDNLGPVLGWWIWDTQDATTLPYVSSVPLTSYHWFFTFTIAFAYVNRFVLTVFKQPKQQLKKIISIFSQPVLTIFLGSLLFVPYNFFAKNMPPYDLLPWQQNLTLAATVHAVLFALAGWLLLVRFKRPNVAQDHLLMVFPFVYLVGHAYLYIAKFDLLFKADQQGLVNGLAMGNLVAVILALIGSSVFVVLTLNTTNHDEPSQPDIATTK